MYMWLHLNMHISLKIPLTPSIQSQKEISQYRPMEFSVVYDINIVDIIQEY